MKSKILLALMILGLSAAVSKSYAADGVAPGYSEVISTYIDSYVTGDFKKLDDVLDDDANVKIPRAGVVLIHSKSNLLQQMKKDAGTRQNCDSKYKVLEKSDAMVIAKVDFKYNDFVQHNYLVLEKNSSNQWKITQVCKFFEDTAAGNGPATYATNNK